MNRTALAGGSFNRKSIRRQSRLHRAAAHVIERLEDRRYFEVWDAISQDWYYEGNIGVTLNAVGDPTTAFRIDWGDGSPIEDVPTNEIYDETIPSMVYNAGASHYYADNTDPNYPSQIWRITPNNEVVDFWGFGITAANYAPEGTINITQQQGESDPVTVSFTNVWDYGDADTQAGFKYSFAIDYDDLATSYSQASSSSSRQFTAAELLESQDGKIFARIFDKDDGIRNYNTDLSFPPTSVAAMSDGRIDLNWSDVPGDRTGWRIQISSDGQNFSYLPDFMQPNTFTYSVTGLPEGARRWFRVRGLGTTGSSGNTSYSPKMSAVTYLKDPSGLSVQTLSTSSIRVNWTDNSSAEQYYDIYRSGGGVSGWQIVGTVGAGVQTFDNTGLSEGTTYSYFVRARNSVAESTWMPQTQSATTILPAPADVEVEALSDSEVLITWTDASSSEQGYNIYRWDDDNDEWDLIGATMADETYFVDRWLDDDQTYSYRVEGFNGYTASSPEGSDNVTTTLGKPDAPSNIAATSTTAGQVDLTWDDNSDNESGFVIQRFDPGASSWTTLPTQTGESYSDTSLQQGKTYRYRVRATNTAGNSKWSETIKVIPKLGAPLAPDGLHIADRSKYSVQLEWIDNSSNEAGFEIYRALDGATFTKVGWVAMDQTSFDASALATGSANEQFKVRAFNSEGNSAFSNLYSTADLTAPTDFAVTWVAPFQAICSWDDNSQEQLFHIQRQETNGAWTNVGSAAENATMCFLGLQSGTYRVLAQRGVNTAVSNTVSVTTPLVDPAQRWETLDSISVGTATYGTWPLTTTYFLDGEPIDWVNNQYWIASASSTLTDLAGTPRVAYADIYYDDEKWDGDGATAVVNDDGSIPLDYSWDHYRQLVWGGEEPGSIALGPVIGDSSEGLSGSATFKLQQKSPTVRFGSSTSSSATEGQGITINVERESSQTIDTPVTVRFAIAGTASGLDFDGLENDGEGYDQIYTLDIPAGQMQASLHPDVINDNLVEGNETIYIMMLGDATYFSYPNNSNSPWYGYSNRAITITDSDVDHAVLTAHRTGGKFGEEVDESLEEEGDPTKLLILTNNDAEESAALSNGVLDFANTSATIPQGSINPVDDDLMRITLKQIPTHLTLGHMKIDLSSSSHVRLFKSNGAVLSNLILDLSDPGNNSYLNGLLSHDVDVWVEGLEKDNDFTLAWEQRDSSNQVVSRDEVHFTIAEWSFIGTDGNEIEAVVPVWKDAIVTAATDESGPWTDRINEGGGSSRSFFKVRIDGLSSAFQRNLRITSDDEPTDYFIDNFDGSAPSDVTQSADYTVLYNSDVYLSADDSLLTPIERDQLKSNLHLNAVHNQSATTRLTTGPAENPNDIQIREEEVLSMDLPMTLQGVTQDLVQVGTTIQGSIKVAAPDWETYNVHVTIYKDQELVAEFGDDIFNPNPQAEVSFQFTGAESGFYKIYAQGFKRLPNGESSTAQQDFLIRVDNSMAQSQFRREAWEGLRLGGVGSVPSNPVIRNRRITQIYATMYNRYSYIRYLGIASFASKLVGDSLQDASNGGLAAGVANVLGFESLPFLGNTKQARDITRQGYELLADGNWAIYADINPTVRAYTSDPVNHPNGNIEAVQALLPDPQNVLRQAWQNLHAARMSQNQTEIWAAASAMVDYEQRVVLQAVIGDTQQKLDFWTSFSQNYGNRIRSPFPGTMKFRTMLPNGSYGDANDRMNWIDAQVIPVAKQWLLDHPNGIDVQTLLSGGYE